MQLALRPAAPGAFDSFAVFAIFDGHGGRRAADYAAHNLCALLTSDPLLVSHPLDAIKNSSQPNQPTNQSTNE